MKESMELNEHWEDDARQQQQDGGMRRIAGVLVLVILLSVAARAFIVHDPVSNAERIVEFGKTMQQWAQQVQLMKDQIDQLRRQYGQFRDFADYRKLIDGAWRSVLPRLEDRQTIALCNIPVQIEWAGWSGTDPFRQISQTRTAAESLDELRKVLDSRTTPSGWARMRDDLETVWGEVPVTTNGIAVEAAHREMRTASLYAGEVYKAIQEKQANIAALKDEIVSGQLAPGDLERKMTILAAEQIDVELLLVQTVNQANRLSVHQLGFQANQAGNLELGRLRDREHRLGLMGNVYFSPAKPPQQEVQY